MNLMMNLIGCTWHVHVVWKKTTWKMRGFRQLTQDIVDKQPQKRKEASLPAHLGAARQLQRALKHKPNRDALDALPQPLHLAGVCVSIIFC